MSVHPREQRIQPIVLPFRQKTLSIKKVNLFFPVQLHEFRKQVMKEYQNSKCKSSVKTLL